MTSTVKEVALHTVKETLSQIYTHTELNGNVSVAVVLINIVMMYTVNLIGSIKHDILNINLEVPEVNQMKRMTINHVMKCITKNDMSLDLVKLVLKDLITVEVGVILLHVIERKTRNGTHHRPLLEGMTLRIFHHRNIVLLMWIINSVTINVQEKTILT